MDSLEPLHVPGTDLALPVDQYLRRPNDPQAHVITAAAKALRQQKSIILCAEMGTGKTLMGACAAFAGAKDGKFRAIVMCPDHLIGKWKREIEITVPGAKVYTFTKSNPKKGDDSWKEVCRYIERARKRLPDGRVTWAEPDGPEFAIIGRDQSKRDPDWIGLTESGAGKLAKRSIVTGTEEVRGPDGNVVMVPFVDYWGDTRYHEKTRQVTRSVPVCPRCGQPIRDKGGALIAENKIADSQLRCTSTYLQQIPQEWGTESGLDAICPPPKDMAALPAGRKVKIGDHKYEVKTCGEFLWAWTRRPNKWAPARIVHKKGRKLFDLLILDEMHEEKSDESGQSLAAGKLMAVSKRIVGLTGTLIGGYAHHLLPLLMRMAPKSLRDEGFEWGSSLEFTRAYGRIDTIVTRRSGGEDSGGRRRGQTSMRKDSANKREVCRPGIMPTLFGRHLIGNVIFLGLEEMAADLPDLVDYGPASGPIPISMDAEQERAYDAVSSTLAAAVKELLAKGSMKLLSTMLHTLLDYPDRPYGWEPQFEGRLAIGYFSESGVKTEANWVDVVQPEHLCIETIRPKEKALIDICLKEKREGRQTWVYLQMTNKRDIQPRLKQILEARGLRVGILRAGTVGTRDREEWIEKNGRKYDVMISFPSLVSTGLDLFSKKEGGHNFPSIVFYQTGYNLFTMRQAAHRAWRISQTLECRVYYLYYKGTMQEQAMSLMGRKAAAAQSVEGKFSAEGLAAMSGEENIMLSLAKSVSDKIEDADRIWSKVAPAKQAKIKSLVESGVISYLAEAAKQEPEVAPGATLVAMEVASHALKDEPQEDPVLLPITEAPKKAPTLAQLAKFFKAMQEMGIKMEDL